LLEHFPPEPKSKPNPSQNGNGAWELSDVELLDKAFAAENGDKLKALYRGDVGGYPSQSEADLALCSMLAFWAADETQLDRFFRRSDLMRDKWDEKHGATTYGERTIEKAWTGRTEHYRGEQITQEVNEHADSSVNVNQPMGEEQAGAEQNRVLFPQESWQG